MSDETTDPELAETDDVALQKAIFAGCTAADVHLRCSYPECSCKQLPKAIAAALLVERGRIATELECQGEIHPCAEDGAVYRSAAWLVRGDFSFEEAERLEIASKEAARAKAT